MKAVSPRFISRGWVPGGVVVRNPETGSKPVRKRPMLRYLAILVALVFVIVLLSVFMGVLPGLPPPDPPETSVSPILVEMNVSIDPGLSSARAFAFNAPVYAQPIEACEWTWDGRWCPSGNGSIPLSFTYTSCASPGRCTAYVGLFIKTDWWKYVNGTNEAPLWCYGQGAACSATASFSLPNLNASLAGPMVFAVWSPSNGTSGVFDFSVSQSYTSYWER
jgi:hypothetical protein